MAITINIKGFDEVLRMLDPKPYRTVMNRAINKLGRRILTETKRLFVSGYAAKQKDIKIKLITATQNRPAFISGSKRNSSLINFAYYKSRGGITAEAKRGKKMFLQGAFVTTVRGGSYKNIFQKRSNGILISTYGASFGSLLQSDYAIDNMNKIVNSEGVDICKHELDYFLSTLK